MEVAELLFFSVWRWMGEVKKKCPMIEKESNK